MNSTDMYKTFVSEINKKLTGAPFIVNSVLKQPAFFGVLYAVEYEMVSSGESALLNEMDAYFRKIVDGTTDTIEQIVFEDYEAFVATIFARLVNGFKSSNKPEFYHNLLRHRKEEKAKSSKRKSKAAKGFADHEITRSSESLDMIKKIKEKILEGDCGGNLKADVAITESESFESDEYGAKRHEKHEDIIARQGEIERALLDAARMRDDIAYSIAEKAIESLCDNFVHIHEMLSHYPVDSTLAIDTDSLKEKYTNLLKDFGGFLETILDELKNLGVEIIGDKEVGEDYNPVRHERSEKSNNGSLEELAIEDAEELVDRVIRPGFILKGYDKPYRKAEVVLKAIKIGGMG